MGIILDILTGGNNNNKKPKCQICGCDLKDYEHYDAWPVAKGECCQSCYENIVLPTKYGD